MADYTELLDEEIQAYIARCDALYPPDAIDLDIAGQRRVYDAMCADFDRGRPAGVVVTDEPHAGLPCRRYETSPSAATVIYYHGGGFVVGGLDSHDSICAEICAETGLRVVAVDYPLAPENSYPEDFNAAWQAYLAISAAYPGSIVLAGDSAGGNLCAAISHKARGGDAAKPIGQVLIYPGLGGALDWPSYVDHAEAPALTRADIEFYMTIRSGGAAITGDPQYAPLHDTDFSALPPTVTVIAECDPIASDGVVYTERLRAAGGQAHLITEKGLIHGYLRAREMSRKAADSFARINAAISALSKGAWPYP